VSGRAWTLADLPDLHGRRALVTGVTSGLGAVTARELARAGAQVLMAARNPDKLAASLEQTRAAVPDADLVPLQVDLADLASVRRAAEQASEVGPLDILVNNAGVMATPQSRTVDGFELQLGTNHLGHFALTGLLLEPLRASPAPRVVTVSSLMARTVRGVSLRDPREPVRHYRKWQAYGQSKLANLLFAFELDRRARRAGEPLTSVAAHPGYTRTNLVDAGMNMGRRRLDGTIGLAVTSLVGQSAEQGALPQLRAAADADLPGGSYVGPAGPFELGGAARVVRPPRPAQDADLASRLWSLSESATGVSFS
jgi:NAD(P)-dependent dehydrogenase (short-subunit alcohol dehydrogenase family)